MPNGLTFQDSSRRQSPELDQPEDESNPSRGERGNKKEENFIVALKVRNTARKANRDIIRNTAKDGTRNTARHITRKTARHITRNTAKDATSNTTRNAYLPNS